MRQKKVPKRMCIGCEEMKEKKELVRIVKSPQGEISIDKTGKSSGRGAYICPNKLCFDKAKKTRKLERSLSCQIPAGIYQALEEEMPDNEK